MNAHNSIVCRDTARPAPGARNQCETGRVFAMKKIAIVAAAFILILLLTKIANNVPPEPPSGLSFWLYAQQVIGCSETEITLVDPHQTETHLEKDSSWPECSTFQKDDVMDFYLSRGAKTHFIGVEKTAWWRRKTI
jgi:hypothetical protein